MDFEFHYYVTYLAATRAGYSSEDAYKIAYSSQFVDDNNMSFDIHTETPHQYTNYLSQTIDVLKPKRKLFRIYLLFHFIPGDPFTESARRKDGKMHWLNTTPDSTNANKILDSALASGNLYRIGIAIHAYLDTWAHQNFVGYYDEFNSMRGSVQSIAPEIGHADAGMYPDFPCLVWDDNRLLNDNSIIDNADRFQKAALRTFEKLYFHLHSEITSETFKEHYSGFKKDLMAILFEQDRTNRKSKKRIKQYIALSTQSEYGGKKLVPYNVSEWFDKAIHEDIRGLKDRSGSFISHIDPFHDKYTWHDLNNYKNTDWYKFQESVKEHQDLSWNLIEEKTFSKMELLNV
ncbi:MAG: hypothetical protein KKG93_06320 [Bacteroidetes bacterium]|nr:hypothetical protein [Bacteroidota bacterium]